MFAANLAEATSDTKSHSIEQGMSPYLKESHHIDSAYLARLLILQYDNVTIAST